MTSETPDRKAIASALDYDPVTGIFRWKIQASNNVAVGRVAGSKNRHGYWRIRFSNREYAAHRLAWFFMTGDWPAAIDHRDLNKLNNSFDNLRPATLSQNSANQLGRGDFPKGVTFHRQTGRFQAQIKKHGKSFYLGLFDTPEAANAAYAAAAKRLFGEFARAA